MSLTPKAVLEKIKELSAKHEIPNTIGVDTVVLVMRTTVAEMMPVLNQLEQEGLVVLHASPNAGKGTPKLTDAGKVSLPVVENPAKVDII